MGVKLKGSESTTWAVLQPSCDLEVKVKSQNRQNTHVCPFPCHAERYISFSLGINIKVWKISQILDCFCNIDPRGLRVDRDHGVNNRILPNHINMGIKLKGFGSTLRWFSLQPYCELYLTLRSRSKGQKLCIDQNLSFLGSNCLYLQYFPVILLTIYSTFQ